jgi:hypothetical protein
MTRRIKRIPPAPAGDWLCAYLEPLAEAECAAGELMKAADAEPSRLDTADPDELEKLVEQLLHLSSQTMATALLIRAILNEQRKGGR